MGHCCRVCARTLELSCAGPDYSTVVADVASLERECGTVETDLRDSFNAFCFQCRRITMSVPVGLGANMQACYLRFQVSCFQGLLAHGLVVDDNRYTNE
jgi:hypothetical protein